MNQKKTMYLPVILCLLSLLLLSGCNTEGGLKYTKNEDGQSYSVAAANENITTVEIPNTYKDLPVTRIADRGFMGCKKLQYVTLPDNITEIGSLAFQASGIVEIDIPDGVTKIEDQAFCECDSLVSVNLPDSLTSLPFSAFRNCRSLQTVYLPEYLVDIGNSAFYMCTGLLEITLPESVKDIGHDVFSGCVNLQRIDIPVGIESLGSSAFDNTPWLESQYDVNGFAVVGTILYQYRGSCKDIPFPDGLTAISEHAFDLYSKDELETLVIPSGIKSIGGETFSVCNNLKYVYLPAGIDYIGDGAFRQSYGISEVHYGGSDAEWSNVTIGSENECLTSAAFYDGFENRFDLNAEQDTPIDIDAIAEELCSRIQISLGSEYEVTYQIPIEGPMCLVEVEITQNSWEVLTLNYSIYSGTGALFDSEDKELDLKNYTLDGSVVEVIKGKGTSISALEKIMSDYTLAYIDGEKNEYRDEIRISPLFQEKDWSILEDYWAVMGGDVDLLREHRAAYSESGSCYAIASRKVQRMAASASSSSGDAACTVFVMAENNSGYAAMALEAFENRAESALLVNGSFKRFKHDGYLSFGGITMNKEVWGPKLYIMIFSGEAGQAGGYTDLTYKFIPQCNEKAFYDKAVEFTLNYYGE